MKFTQDRLELDKLSQVSLPLSLCPPLPCPHPHTGAARADSVSESAAGVSRLRKDCIQSRQRDSQQVNHNHLSHTTVTTSYPSVRRSLWVCIHDFCVCVGDLESLCRGSPILSSFKRCGGAPSGRVRWRQTTETSHPHIRRPISHHPPRLLLCLTKSFVLAFLCLFSVIVSCTEVLLSAGVKFNFC
jgi:hypothetical protein